MTMHRHPNPACDGAGERRFWTQGHGREAPVPRARSPGGAGTSQGHRGKCPHKQNPEGGTQSRACGSCRRVALSKPLAPCLGFPSWGLEQPGWPRCPLHTVPSPSSVGPRVDTRMAGPTGRGRGRTSRPVHGDDSETSASQPLRRAEPHPGLCARRPSAPLRPHARDEPLGSAPGLRVELGLPLLAPVCNDHGGRGRPPRAAHTQTPPPPGRTADWACMAGGGRDGQRPHPPALPVSRAGTARPWTTAAGPTVSAGRRWHRARPCTRRAAQHPLGGSSSAHGSDGEMEARGTQSPVWSPSL